MAHSKLGQNWNDLRLFLPKGWTSKAKELGVYTRKRQFSSVAVLLRVLLIHLLEGCSLKETAVRAKQGKICNVSHVAIHKRLKLTAEWFQWMSIKILEQKGRRIMPPNWLKDYSVKTTDGSVISEPGSTGTNWRLHYSMTLFDLRADQFLLTDPSVGETFKNFNIKPNELWIGDRAYCYYTQLKYIKDHDADFLVRWKINGASLFQNGKPFDLLEHVSKLKKAKIGEWCLHAGVKGKPQSSLPIRIFALRKSELSAERAVRVYKAELTKKGKSCNTQTLELQKYIILATSLPLEIESSKIMELYRARWQQEIAFKRMKSIVGLGQLPKKDPESCLAWLQGKHFVCILIQAVLDEARLFSPWGYPLKKA